MAQDQIKGALPPLFLERLRLIIPEDQYAASLHSFNEARSFCARVNTLKISVKAVLRQLKEAGIEYGRVKGIPEALVFDNEKAAAIERTSFFTDGLLYRQNLSSILVSRILGPRPGERVLDMCAAPGGKATHLAALMRCQGQIVAIEAIRKRYYKLRSIASLLGAACVTSICMDARRFKPRDGLFDRILLDAQCTCEAGFAPHDPASFAYWSLRKIKELSYKQKGLILAAGRLLNAGGILVYATCTFAPEENEMVIDWFLKKTAGDFSVEAIRLGAVPRYPALVTWQGRALDPAVSRCLRVVPSQHMEGFFIARLKKIR